MRCGSSNDSLCIGMIFYGWRRILDYHYRGSSYLRRISRRPRMEEQEVNKRQFLKITGAAAAGTFFSRYAKADEPTAHMTNWAGNLRYHADKVLVPHNLNEAKTMVQKATRL